jgi:hypothetical protein
VDEALHLVGVEEVPGPIGLSVLLARERREREFALLALATFARMGLVAAQFNKDPGIAALLPWAPVVLWVLAGALLLSVFASTRRGATAGSSPSDAP